MNPFALIFQSIGTLTGGLISDLSSVIVGLVALSFIALAVDHITWLLSGTMHRRMSNKYYERAEMVRQARDTNSRGSAAWLQQDMLYKRFLRRSVDESEQGWR